MHKHRLLQTVLLSTVLALLAIVLMTPVASAHTAAPAHGAATATGHIPVSVPNVNIVTTHGKAVFSPSTIHCKSRGPKKSCFTITNLTHKAQKVIFNGPNGTTSTTIPPGFIAEFDALNPGLRIGFFRLKSNPQALLTVTSS